MKTFDGLFAELADKAERRPAGSGTVAALDAGVHAIGKKVLEEAAEALRDLLALDPGYTATEAKGHIVLRDATARHLFVDGLRRAGLPE